MHSPILWDAVCESGAHKSESHPTMRAAGELTIKTRLASETEGEGSPELPTGTSSLRVCKGDIFDLTFPLHLNSPDGDRSAGREHLR